VTAISVGARVRIPIELRRVVTGATLLAVAVVLCALALAESAVPMHSVVWGSLALASYAAGLFFLASAKTDEVGLAKWRFGSWTLLWYGLTFGLATATWSAPQASTTAQIATSSLLRTLWLVAVGLTSWVMGYFLGAGGLLRRLGDRWIGVLSGSFAGTVRSRLTPWILYAVGTAARIGSAASTGRFGYVGDVSSAVSTASGYQEILSMFSLFAPLGVSAAALQVYRERLPGTRLTLAILFLAELAYGGAAGGKQDFVIAVLAVIIPMSAARHRLPKVAVIGGLLAFLMIVIPFNLAYRSTAREGTVTLSASQAVGEAPKILHQTLSANSLVTAVPNSLIYLLQRVQEINSPAIIVQRTPGQIPYSSPVQLVEAPLVDMVPRAVWPGKPILATGYQFNQQYYGLPSTLYTSSAITPVGDLYRHGGWIPVMVGMFLLGCGVRLLDDVLDVRTNPHAIFLVLLLFPSLVQGEQDMVTLLAGIPATMLVWLSAVALTFRVRRPA
jgi:hypothetical protein